MNLDKLAIGECFKWNNSICIVLETEGHLKIGKHVLIQNTHGTKRYLSSQTKVRKITQEYFLTEEYWNEEGK